MKILIADDSYEKVKIIAEGAKLAGIPDDMIKHVSCSKDALRELSKNKYDVFFVDIQLPAILGGDIESQGGVDLIKNIEINELINKPKFIAGITSHSETYSEIKNFFIQRGWPLLYEELSVELISKIINIRNYELEMKFDIAFIAALEHTELEAILSLPCSWTQFSVNNDPNIYYSGNLFIENGVNLKLLATSCSRMGMASASALSAKISLQFKPELIVMTGIAAGIEGKVNLGDIIVADTIWDWGSGKLTIKDKKPVLLPLTSPQY
ncbi:hypothetical protein [Pantoea ananatis]|uniref:phosphorylase family protein n=1 Tax=Pantoea ananas TaxID=553 RepID=UPI001B312F79|nr:hypothetical protein [Pantoea ananatis]